MNGSIFVHKPKQCTLVHVSYKVSSTVTLSNLYLSEIWLSNFYGVFWSLLSTWNMCFPALFFVDYRYDNPLYTS